MFKKIISLVLSVIFSAQTCGFAQVAQLNLAGYLGQAGSATALDRFRPAHLRYFSYEPKSDNFQILLDKADEKGLSDIQVKDKADQLMKYFRIGLSLPNEKFWVNLRPDAPEQIIDPELEQTDIGKIMLEADLQLKKDTASFTSPQTKEGKEYWDKLYKKAGELFGSENITIPTITRPWIVPGEIIVRESGSSGSTSLTTSAYIYKAALKVMLEEDYLKSSQPSDPNYQPLTSNYNFSDPRLKELNQYSTQLIRETIIPKLTKEINRAKRYAGLRQVFYSLVLSRWFKARYRSQITDYREQRTEKADNYLSLIDSGNLSNLTSKEAWDKTVYFKAYQKSFKEGEYNLSEPVYTPTGQVIRRYMSGGTEFTSSALTIGNHYNTVSVEKIPFGANVSSLNYTSGGNPVAVAAASPLESLKNKALGRLSKYLDDKMFQQVSPYISNARDIDELQEIFDNTVKSLKNKVKYAGAKAFDAGELNEFSKELGKMQAKIAGSAIEEEEIIEAKKAELGGIIETVFGKLEKTYGLQKTVLELQLDRSNSISEIEKVYDRIIEVIDDNDKLEKEKKSLKAFSDSLKEISVSLNKSGSPLTLDEAKESAIQKIMKTTIFFGEEKGYDKYISRIKTAKNFEHIYNKIVEFTLENESKIKKEDMLELIKEEERLDSCIFADDFKGYGITAEWIRQQINGRLISAGRQAELNQPVDMYINFKVSGQYFKGWRNMKMHIHENAEDIKKNGVYAYTIIVDQKPDWGHLETYFRGEFFSGGDVVVTSMPEDPFLSKAERRYNVRELASSIKGVLSEGGASSALTKQVGGIDFRSMNMLVQPMGSFSGLDFSPIRLSSSALESMDLDKEFEGIKQLASGSMLPSPQRLKEYISACIFKVKIGGKADDFILSMLEVFQLQAEEGIESAPEEREAVVMADTRSYVLPEETMAASNSHSLN